MCNITDPEYSGWTIIHRVLAEYDAQLPGYANYIQTKLVQDFPGANVLKECYLQSAEEPIVIAPAETPEAALCDVKEKARKSCNQVVQSLFPVEHSTSSSVPTQPAVQALSSSPQASVTNPNEVQGTWIVVVPVFHLVISDSSPIYGQWDVGDVSFVSRARLLSFLQPPTIASSPSPSVFQRITEDDVSFAVANMTGTPTQLRHRVFRDFREAANVLAATAAFYGKRHHASGFTLKGYPAFTGKSDRFIQTDGGAFCGDWNQRGHFQPFVLDALWHQAINQSGIIDLFARITDSTLNADWRRQIRSGAAMLGRSIMSLDLADAFLLDVIGLETLLTRLGERNGRRLFQRIKGMTGWHLRYARPNYEDEIKTIHKVRCEIVHDSDYANLTSELLLQADMYLSNSLLNIVRIPTEFPDKSNLARKLDGFAEDENWPTDGSVPFCWFGNSQFSQADLDLPLW